MNLTTVGLTVCIFLAVVIVSTMIGLLINNLRKPNTNKTPTVPQYRTAATIPDVAGVTRFGTATTAQHGGDVWESQFPPFRMDTSVYADTAVEADTPPELFVNQNGGYTPPHFSGR